MGGITDTITIMNGWMDIDKNILYIVTARPSGQVNIADSGSLTGTITSSAGPIMYNIKKGLLSLSKNHASITLEFGTKGENGHRQDTGFMIRKSNNFTIAPLMNLLPD